MFRLKIETDNAVFAVPGVELSRILTELAERVRDLTVYYTDRGAIMDANGNTVGTWSYEPSKE